MEQVLEVFYDGHVFKPVGKVDLPPNRQYIFRIKQAGKSSKNAIDVLEELAGSIEMPEDWAVNHDNYLYGEPDSNG